MGDAPVVPRGIAGSWDDRFTDPGAVVYYDGMFHMFRNGFRGFPAASQVGYVTSPDGYTWTKQGEEPVFETKDVPYAKIAMYASSALVEEDGTWVIYFYTWDSSAFPSSGDIGRATAPNPTGPWTPGADLVLKPGPASAWDGKHVLAPHVLKIDDRYVMYYSGYDRSGTQWIGMATSADGVKWEKYNDSTTTDAAFTESDPVLKTSEAGKWDAGLVHQPRVFQTADGWVMFYRGLKSKNSNDMALGLATSADGVHWVRSSGNPLFKPSDIPKAQYFWFTNIVLKEDVYYLFIEGDISQTTQIYLATHKGIILK